MTYALNKWEMLNSADEIYKYVNTVVELPSVANSARKSLNS